MIISSQKHLVLFSSNHCRNSNEKIKEENKTFFFSVVQLFEIAIGTIIPELLLVPAIIFCRFFFFFVVELQLSMYAEEEKGPSLPSSYCTR